MQRILGIDLGATAVKAVAIESSFRSHTLSAYRAEPVLPDSEAEPKPYAERVKPALEALAKDEWFHADTVICCLPAAQVATHQLTLPFTDRKQIEATLPSEVEDLIPFNLDEVVFDWHVLSRAPGKTDVLVAVALKRDVQAVLDALKTVNVDPGAITFSAMALANLYACDYLESVAATPETPAPVEAIVDIGAERTNIVLTEGGQFRLARTIAPGGAMVTRALARALNVPFEEAEHAKLALGSLTEADPTVTAVVDRACSGLIREVRATFASYATRSKRKVEKVLICGGGAKLAGLEAMLGEALGVPVAPVVLHGVSAFPDPEELSRGTLALALGLRGVGGSGVVRLDFRKGEFAFTKTAGEVRSLYIRLGAMAAALVVLFGFSMWSKLHALETRETAIDDTLCQTTKKILHSCEKDFRVAIGKLKGAGSPAASIPVASAVDITNALSNSFPASNDSVLSELDIVDSTVLLRGDAKGYEAVDDLVTGIQTNKCFADVHKGKLQKGKEGRVEFSIDATYACGSASTKKAGS